MDKTTPITMTPLSFIVDEAMVTRASLLHLGRYRAYFIGAVGFWVFMTVLPVLVRIGVWDARSIITQALQNAAITLFVAGVLLVLLRRVFFPFVARRNFRQQKAFAQDMRLSWSETDICYATGRSRTLAPFTDFYGYRLSDDLILLYLSNVIYLLVPVSAFDNVDQKADFIARLHHSSIKRL